VTGSARGVHANCRKDIQIEIEVIFDHKYWWTDLEIKSRSQAEISGAKVIMPNKSCLCCRDLTARSWDADSKVFKPQGKKNLENSHKYWRGRIAEGQYK
jgi:hypothetical protein